jgi:hypothetical protein
MVNAITFCACTNEREKRRKKKRNFFMVLFEQRSNTFFLHDSPNLRKIAERPGRGMRTQQP